MRNTLIIWGAVIIVIIGSLFAIYKIARAPTSQSNGGNIPALNDKDETRGSKDAKVVLVEYSDFQCPACGNFYPTVEEINKELEGKILFAYRNFPLPQHKNADLAARAAESAGKQGKFWEMYKAIFSNQNEWSESDNARDIFSKYATSIGLDMNKYSGDLTSSDIKDKITADQLGGQRAGVNATPTFYLNGKKMTGYNSFDDFKKQIRDAVQQNP